jgi:hypothetical protein
MSLFFAMDCRVKHGNDDWKNKIGGPWAADRVVREISD